MATQTPPHASIDEKLVNEIRVLAPWERVFDRFLTPFERFVESQVASGVLLVVAAITAMLLANSALGVWYARVLELPLAVTLGPFGLSKSLHHWINEGLMTLFFFVVGLEIKCEMLVGELSKPRQAVLPMIAAVGGMVVPALIYVAIVPTGDPLRGWGIPMATDIAFAVGALVLLGARAPRSLLTFLLALAIVDDLGALIVIALFYTSDLNVTLLVPALGVLFGMIACNRFGLRRPWPYFALATVLWVLLLESGVHATIAGVLAAFTIPVLPRYHPARFSALFDTLTQRYRDAVDTDPSPLRNQQLRSTLQTMENAIVGVRSPLERLLHRWETPVALIVMPVFALANAGIALDPRSALDALGHPVTLGILLGLVIGKPLGITATAWLGVRFGLCQLPTDITWRQLLGVSLLAGIGFTMSLFIGELAFVGHPQDGVAAKFGVLLASLIAGTAGFLWLRASGRTVALES